MTSWGASTAGLVRFGLNEQLLEKSHFQGLHLIKM
jgi:hypothetical protein